jgi:hypothetical protein
MAVLGDGFPPEKRRAFIENRLVPGCIIRIEVKFPQTTKPKFLVLVADDDPDCCMFIVNSEIHPFIQARPHLLKCQVKIDTANHAFLKRDSYLACDKTLRLRRSDVVTELMKNVAGVQGSISTDVRDEIVSAVKAARTLSPVEKSQILVSLRDK